MPQKKRPAGDELDDFAIALEAIRLTTEAFQAYVADVERAKVDSRIIRQGTRERMTAAGQMRIELAKRIAITNALMVKAMGDYH